MGKLIIQDGKHYRLRRGKLVQIPPEWVGQVTCPQTIRRRKEKAKAGQKKRSKTKNHLTAFR